MVPYLLTTILPLHSSRVFAAGVLEIDWSPAQLTVFKRTSVARIADASQDTYSRAATFEGPEHCSLKGRRSGTAAVTVSCRYSQFSVSFAARSASLERRTV
jgi:hypothetical protein